MPLKWPGDGKTMKMLEKHRVLKWLILCNLTLVTLYLVSNHVFMVPSWTIRHWFDLQAEANIPTWFSSAQLLLLFILSILYSIHIDSKHLRSFYSLIGLVFLFFSADETSEIHESITSIFKQLSMHSFFPHAHGMWILVYPIILIVLTFIFRKGLLAFLNERIGRTVFVIGAVVFVAGGVGFEVFGYYSSSHQGPESILSVIGVTAEESLELLGQSLMIYALLSKLSTHADAAKSEENTTDKASQIA